MLNEVQEFKDYTQFPAYTSTGPRDTTYLGRFTVEAIRDFHGFDRVFTILARHFLFQDGDPYENEDRARQALCAWASIPDGGDDLKGWEGKFTTCFPELHEEFPDLVDVDGCGWYIRHIRSISAFAQQNPKKVKAGVHKYLVDKLPDFEAKWRDKARQFQIPIFLERTDAIWQVRFDDVIANALTLGPLREMEAEVTEQQKEKFTGRSKAGVSDYPGCLLSGEQARGFRLGGAAVHQFQLLFWLHGVQQESAEGDYRPDHPAV